MLSRYLYHNDEVKYSIITSILKREDFNECLFWISEYYYSGYEIWNLVWKMYYDFYAINSPKLERFIKKMYEKWIAKKKIVYILHIFKNFYFNPHPSNLTFLVRMKMKTQTTPANSYLGRTPKWLKNFQYKKKYKNLLLSIHKKHYSNIAYYLNRYKKNIEELYNLIVDYYEKIKEINLKKNWKHFEDHLYSNRLHILIALICHLNIPEKEIHIREIHLLIDDAQLKFVVETNTLPDRLYKTLKLKRLFKINPNISCFDLERYTTDIQQILWNHWEYYSYSTPIWKERFDKYEIQINNEEHSIKFKKEDEEIDFYEKYNYEPDEQDKETQEKSIGELIDLTITDWVLYIFKDQVMCLDNKKKYKY